MQSLADRTRPIERVLAMGDGPVGFALLERDLGQPPEGRQDVLDRFGGDPEVQSLVQGRRGTGEVALAHLDVGKTPPPKLRATPTSMVGDRMTGLIGGLGPASVGPFDQGRAGGHQVGAVRLLDRIRIPKPRREHPGRHRILHGEDGVDRRVPVGRHARALLAGALGLGRDHGHPPQSVVDLPIQDVDQRRLPVGDVGPLVVLESLTDTRGRRRSTPARRPCRAGRCTRSSGRSGGPRRPRRGPSTPAARPARRSAPRSARIHSDVGRPFRRERTSTLDHDGDGLHDLADRAIGRGRLASELVSGGVLLDRVGLVERVLEDRGALACVGVSAGMFATARR